MKTPAVSACLVAAICCTFITGCQTGQIHPASGRSAKYCAGYALIGTWNTDPIGSPARLESTSNSLSVSFGVSAPPPKDKCVVSIPVRMSLAGWSGILVDVHNESERPVRLAFALRTGKGGYFESEAMPLRSGANPDVFFGLNTNTYKSAATSWQHTAAPEGLSETRQILLLVYAQGKGRAVFRNVRLASPLTSPPADASALLPFVRDCRWGYADVSGRQVIEPRFDRAFKFSEGLAPVLINRKYGYIDANAGTVIEPLFEKARGFACGLAGVRVGGKWGYIRRDGSYAVKPALEDAGDFRNGIAGVKIDGSYGFIDMQGTTLVTPSFESVLDFSEGLAAVRQGGKWGYVDSRGNTVIQPRFEEARSFSEQLAAVKIGGKWGYVNPKGEMVLKPEFALALDFSSGLAPVESDGKWGYTDAAGRHPIWKRFDMATPFSEGLAAVMVGGRWGFIRTNGVFAIDPVFDGAAFFAQGSALVQVFDPAAGLLSGYINTAGDFIFPPAGW